MSTRPTDALAPTSGVEPGQLGRPGRAGSSRLRNDPVFRRYWAAHTVSTAGSTITLVVLPILVFQRTGSALLTSGLDAVFIGPYLLFGLFAGVFADRVDRQRLMVAAEFAGAFALGSLPLASAARLLTTVQIFTAAGLAGTAFVLFDAAQFGALPTSFGRERLIMTMTALGSVDNALYVAGPGLGGFLAAAIGPAPAITVDAVSFLISGVFLGTIRRPFREPPTPGQSHGQRWRAEIADGIHYLWRHRLIRAFTLAGAAGSVTSGAVVGLLVVFSVRQLSIGTHDSRIGLLFSAGAVGALVGTALIPRLTRGFPIPRLNLVSRTASLLLVLVFIAQRQFLPAVVAYACWQAADSVATRSAITFRQLHTPDRLQGRVNVVGRMLALSGTPLGAAMGGGLADLLGLRTSLLVMTGGLAVATISGWLGPLRTAGSPPVTSDTG